MMKLIFLIYYYYLIDKLKNLRKAFANYTSANIRLSKTQLSKTVQSGGFLGRLLGPLLTILPLIKNVIKPLAKSVLILLEITEEASTADAEIRKKNLRLWNNSTDNIK